MNVSLTINAFVWFLPINSLKFHDVSFYLDLSFIIVYDALFVLHLVFYVFYSLNITLFCGHSFIVRFRRFPFESRAIYSI